MAEPAETKPPGAGLQRVFTTVVLILVVGNAVRIGFHHRHFVFDHPLNLVWVLGSLLAGFGVFSLNGAGIELRRAWPWLGYGVLATYFGFAVQGGVNGGLLREMGGTPGGLGYVALGFGAAASQTLGKWLVLRFVGSLGALRSPERILSIGLAVGLGFGLAEVVILGENQIVRQAGITTVPVLGIWERAVAIGLHVFSGAVLAMAIVDRQWMPVVVVLAVHGIDDAVAGAVAGGLITMPVLVVELFFSAMTVLLWLYYRGLRDRCLASGGPEAV